MEGGLERHLIKISSIIDRSYRMPNLDRVADNTSKLSMRERAGEQLESAVEKSKTTPTPAAPIKPPKPPQPVQAIKPVQPAMAKTGSYSMESRLQKLAETWRWTPADGRPGIVAKGTGNVRKDLITHLSTVKGPKAGQISRVPDPPMNKSASATTKQLGRAGAKFFGKARKLTQQAAEAGQEGSKLWQHSGIMRQQAEQIPGWRIFKRHKAMKAVKAQESQARSLGEKATTLHGQASEAKRLGEQRKWWGQNAKKRGI